MPKRVKKSVVTTEPRATIEPAQPSVGEQVEEMRRIAQRISSLEQQLAVAKAEYDRAEVGLAKALDQLRELGFNGTLKQIHAQFTARVTELQQQESILAEQIEELNADAPA